MQRFALFSVNFLSLIACLTASSLYAQKNYASIFNGPGKPFSESVIFRGSKEVYASAQVFPSPNSEHIGVLGPFGITVINSSSLDTVFSMVSINVPATAVSWNSSGTKLFIGFKNGGVISFDVLTRDQNPLVPLPKNQQPVQELSVSRDDQILLVLYENGELLSVDLEFLDILKFDTNRKSRSNISWSPDSRYFVLKTDRNLEVWDAENRTVDLSQKLPLKNILNLVWTSSGNEIFLLDDCARILRINARSLDIVGTSQTVDVPCSQIISGRLMDDGRQLVLLKRDTLIQLEIEPAKMNIERIGKVPLLKRSVDNYLVRGVDRNLFYTTDEGSLFQIRWDSDALNLAELQAMLFTNSISFNDIIESPVFEDVGSPDDLKKLIKANPVLTNFFAPKSQFETQSEFEARIWRCLPALIDELSRARVASVRVSSLYAKLSQNEIVNSRRPENLRYGVDFELGDYNLLTSEYPIISKKYGTFILSIDRISAQELFDNVKDLSIEGISQTKLGSKNRELINAELRNSANTIVYKLTKFIDLLDVYDGMDFPPNVQVHISNESWEEDTLTIKLSNLGEGDAQDLRFRIWQNRNEYLVHCGNLSPGSEKTMKLPLAKIVNEWNIGTDKINVALAERGEAYLLEQVIDSLSNVSQESNIVSQLPKDADSRLYLMSVPFEDGKTRDLIVSNDGRFLGRVSDKKVSIIDNLTKKVLREFDILSGEPLMALFSTNTEFLIVISKNKKVNVFNVQSGFLFQEFDINENISQAYLSKSSDDLLCVYNDGNLVSYNFRTGRVTFRSQLVSGMTNAILDLNNGSMYGLNGTKLIALHYLSNVVKWTKSIPVSCVNELEISKDGRHLLALGCDSTVYVLEASSGKQFRQLIRGNSKYTNAAWSPSLGYLVTLDNFSNLTFWDSEDLVPIEEFKVHLNADFEDFVIPYSGENIILYSSESIEFYRTNRRGIIEREIQQYGINSFVENNKLNADQLKEISDFKNLGQKDQFESDLEYTFRREQELRGLASKLYFLEQQEIVNERIRANEKAKSIADSRKRVLLGNEYYELGKYDLRSGEYSIRIGNNWERLVLSKDDARQFHMAASDLRIEGIRQLQENLLDSEMVNLVVYHPMSSKAFKIGRQVVLASGELNSDLPPQLEVVKVAFMDVDGDNFLSAGERAQLKFTIANKGQGLSRFVSISGENQNGISGLSGIIETLNPGELKEVFIPVVGSLGIEDGETKVIFNIADAAGFTSDPVSIGLTTRAFRKPDVQLVDIGVSDSEGRALIRPGSVVSITIRLKNFGEGPSEQVNLKLSAGEGVTLINGVQNTLVASIGALSAKGQKDFTFKAFCNDLTTDFPLSISIKDENNEAYSLGKDLGLVVNKPQKGLTELFFSGNDLIAENGSEESDFNFSNFQPMEQLESAIALVIGNKNYKGAIPPVDYALNDAFSVRDFLIHVKGFKPGNIILLEDATLSDLKVVLGDKEIKGRLSDVVIQDKTEIFVYYSGHGAPGANTGESYILPVDANPDKLELTAIKMPDLLASINSLSPAKVVFAIDACFSGGINGGGNLVKNASSLAIKLKPVKLSSDKEVFISASGDNEVASWYKEKRHGLFTYYLLKGLIGEADSNNDNSISTKELKSYLQDRQNGIPYKARELYSREQMPQINGGDDVVLVNLKAISQ